MQTGPSMQTLRDMNVQTAFLCIGTYAMPVRFQIRDKCIECRVPVWSGMGDLLEQTEAVGLVVVVDPQHESRWLFIRGKATVVIDPEWGALSPPTSGGVVPDDLYQLLCITPKRIEMVDEQKGWGYRETVDL